MPSAMPGESGRSVPQVPAPGVALWTFMASPGGYRVTLAHNLPSPSLSSPLAMARPLEPSVQGRLAWRQVSGVHEDGDRDREAADTESGDLEMTLRAQQAGKDGPVCGQGTAGRPSVTDPHAGR